MGRPVQNQTPNSGFCENLPVLLNVLRADVGRGAKRPKVDLSFVVDGQIEDLVGYHGAIRSVPIKLGLEITGTRVEG
jgi:hypothetical protein